MTPHTCEKEGLLATLESTTIHHEKSLEEHHLSLYGGGMDKPGLVRTVDGLTSWRTDMEKARDAQKLFMMQVRVGLVIIIVTALLNFILKR
jgi:hypothetical protein